MTTVFITGANRGIGLEFVRQYTNLGYRVIAGCRNPLLAQELHHIKDEKGSDLLDIVELDVKNFKLIDEFAVKFKGQAIDIIINNAGIFGPKALADKDYRQNFGSIDYDIWTDILRTNTMAPLKIAEAFYENLLIGEQKKIITMSSLVGSIELAEGSELFSYRTSKTAVNMAMKMLADKTAHENIICTLFSPGWVKTEMGGTQADLNVDDSVRILIELIESLTLKESGQFLNYDGKLIPW